MRTLVLGLVGIHVTLAPVSSVRSQDDWPVFRGGADGRGFRAATAGRERPAGAALAAPRLLWTFDARTGIESTAAIAAGRVYVGTSGAGLLCLELSPAGKEGGIEKGGREVWRARSESGIRSSPGVREGKVYYGDDAGVFRALDAASGKEVWTFKEAEGPEIISSAAFHDDKVLFGSYDGYLYAVGARDGKLAWKLHTEGPVHATPTIAEGRTFVAGCDEVLRAVDLAAGKEVWSMPLGSNNASTPAVDGERLYLATYGARVLCVKWKGAGEGGDPILWSFENPERKFPYYASPAVAPPAAGDGGAAPARRGIVVIGGRDKVVHALAAETGKEIWSFSTGGRVDASCAVVGGSVFAASMDGNLYLLDLESGKEVWRFTAGGAFIASPAVAAGKLVIASEEGLVYCFDLEPGKQ